MNLTVTGHHLAITGAIRGYVEQKMERILRHFDHVQDVHVCLAVVKVRHQAEVTVHVRGKDVHVEASDANMYAAIDALVDKLDRALLRYKSRTYDPPHVAIKHAQL
jgi:putative sigma-54 modulation protein